jgi:hypothetical protein
MDSTLHYDVNTGHWWVETSTGELIDIKWPADKLLRYCEELPKNTSALLIASKLISEIRSNGGFFGFFFSSAGVLAPNGHAALRRIGMPESAAILREAMEVLGNHYPQGFAKRMHTMADDWKGDAPRGDVADRLRCLSASFHSSLGGKGAPRFKQAVRTRVEAQMAVAEPVQRTKDA